MKIKSLYCRNCGNEVEKVNFWYEHQHVAEGKSFYCNYATSAFNVASPAPCGCLVTLGKELIFRIIDDRD